MQDIAPFQTEFSPSSESPEDKTDALIHLAEEAMPYCESEGDWTEFNRIRTKLESMPYTYAFVTAGPDVSKNTIRNLKVDLQSVKGNDYEQFYDYMNECYGSLLKKREMCVAACLLENVHQHVKKGIGFCVIRIVLGRYKRITVSDNGAGFFNYKKQKPLSVKDAIKYGRAYGSRYKSLGQALAISFGLWADLGTVETPNETTIVVPERFLKKMLRAFYNIAVSLLFAVGTDFLILIIRNQDISLTDAFITAGAFLLFLNRNSILSLFTKKSEKKYFPELAFKARNRQEFGSSLSAYFCSTQNVNRWRKQLTEKLEVFLEKRADTFRSGLT